MGEENASETRDLFTRINDMLDMATEYQDSWDYEVYMTSRVFGATYMAHCIDKTRGEYVSAAIRPVAKDRELAGEIQILLSLHHQDILKFLGCTVSLDRNKIGFIYETHLCLLAECFAFGNGLISSPKVVKAIMMGLYRALAYLHDNEIVHRDINPANIALTSSGDVKVWNFSSACKFGEVLSELNQNNDLRYQPVESIMSVGLAYASIDVWSAAIIFSEMFHLEPIFSSESKYALLKEIFTSFGFPSQNDWPAFYKFRQFSHIRGYKLRGNSLYDIKVFASLKPVLTDSCCRLLENSLTYNDVRRSTSVQCLQSMYFCEVPLDCGPELMVTVVNTTAAFRAKIHEETERKRQREKWLKSQRAK